jgi:eukaryotic-like serine/threonine-protein kinase
MLESPFAAAALTSGLVSLDQLDYALRVARHRVQHGDLQQLTNVSDPLLAELLVEQQVLTRYQADQLAAGRTKLNLGPYVITDWIGQGGMGQVFKAEHQVMGRPVAVKVLPLSRATHDAMLAFRREIRLQAKLDCLYLVRAFDAGQDGNVHYLVTEFVPGMDLRRLVRKQGRLPVDQAARIIMQAALGLAYAHRQGLIHRDVKPGNILVTPDGQAKVSDVGLAGVAANLLDDPRAGKIIGTADYLSPEQIRTPLDIAPASDIYSLGCSLYYAVCGKVPFPGGNTSSKLKRHLEDTPWHPRRLAPELSEEFVEIIADMMDKDPKRRIATADEVAARLEAWAADADELTAYKFSRGPWSAPPPPSGDSSGGDARETRATGDRGGNRAPEDAPDTDAASDSPTLQRLHPALAAGDRSDVIGEPMDGSGSYSLSIGGIVSPALPDWGGPSSATAAASSLFGKHAAPPISKGLTVAITLALALPPALLSGAILGFLLRGSLSGQPTAPLPAPPSQPAATPPAAE